MKNSWRSFSHPKQMLLVWLTLLTLHACTSQPTPAAESPTVAVSPTPRPTITHTPMIELPDGPFVWQGDTRPLLMAHYMPWYQAPPVSESWGWHWTMNHFNPTQREDGAWTGLASHYTPLIGPYDSSDEAVLEYQTLLMKLSGIDGVIVDWYGIENFWDYGAIHSSTEKLFQAVEKAGLTFVICYEDQTLKHMIDNQHLAEEDALAHGQEVMKFLQDHWFGQEAYLKVSGKPVLFTFGPQYFKGEAWGALFSTLDPQPLLFTLDKHYVPLQTASFPWPPMWASKAGVLSHNALQQYLADFYAEAETRNYVVGGAFPGFHDIYEDAGAGSSYGYLDALDGKTFRYTLQEALNYQPDMVQLITWNDYGEGTIIEPTVEFEYRYLEMVQEARQITGAGDFPFQPADLRLPFELYQLRVRYSDDKAVNARLDEVYDALIVGDAPTADALLEKFR